MLGSGISASVDGSVAANGGAESQRCTDSTTGSTVLDSSGLEFLSMVGEELRALLSSSSSLSLVDSKGSDPSRRSVAHCRIRQPSPLPAPKFSLSRNPMRSSKAS